MFYAANRALGAKGYKVVGQNKHKTTVEALIVLLREEVADNLIDAYQDSLEEALALIQTLEYERNKRARIQYETSPNIQRTQAKTSYERAVKLCTVLEQIHR